MCSRGFDILLNRINDEFCYTTMADVLKGLGTFMFLYRWAYLWEGMVRSLRSRATETICLWGCVCKESKVLTCRAKIMHKRQNGLWRWIEFMYSVSNTLEPADDVNYWKHFLMWLSENKLPRLWHKTFLLMQLNNILVCYGKDLVGTYVNMWRQYDRRCDLWNASRHTMWTGRALVAFDHT